jgi:phosphoglycerate dehydrogenase-like enzyme
MAALQTQPASGETQTLAPTRIAMMVKIAHYRRALTERLEGRADVELRIAESEEELDAVLTGADAFIFNGSAYSPRVEALVLRHARTLRWLHTTSAGNEVLVERGAPATMTVTRSGGHSAPVVAEHAIALLLALARGLGIAMDNQRKRVWARDRSGRRIGTTRSLIGRAAVVLGFGPIGQAIGERLRVLGMRVIAVSRGGHPHPAADIVYPASGLREALSQASVLVVAAPGGPETRQMIGAEELAALQPDGFVVNIGRGSVIDTAAIEAALRDGTILGAGLDVVDPEPLPEEHSLWSAPNLLITPHRGGGGDPLSGDRQAVAVVENLERFRRGDPLEHVLRTRVLPASEQGL